MKLRPEVLKFARAMEAKLRLHDKNRGKSGWKGDKKLGLSPSPQVELVSRLEDEFREFIISYKNPYNSEFVVDKDELCDIANFCMMLFDIS